MKTRYIDVEPTWSSLLSQVERGNLKPEVLRPACAMSDSIRQAQKKGAKEIRISFLKNGMVKLKKVF